MLHLKTSQEVVRDFYMFLRYSAIGRMIRGDIYQEDERPRDATTEDVVIKFLTGEDTLLQRGVVICNIYVQDIIGKGGLLVADKPRIAQLERAIHAFIDDFPCTDGYQISTDGTPTVVLVDDLPQHYIYTRFKFYRRAS